MTLCAQRLKWINVKNVHLMKLFGWTGVLIGMFFLFCSQDEVSNDPRQLRAVLGLDETNDEMASGNVSFSERSH